jgi:parvulin-like peptidyl-prolyl isomerase
VPDNTYDVTDTSNYVPPFKRLAANLKVGEVGYCESDFGFHILKRIE